MFESAQILEASRIDEITEILLLPKHILLRFADEIPAADVSVAVEIGGQTTELDTVASSSFSDPSNNGPLLELKCDFSRYLNDPAAKLQVWVHGFLLHEQFLPESTSLISGRIDGIQDGHLVGWAAHLLGEALPSITLVVDGAAFPRIKPALMQHWPNRYASPPACSGFRIKLPRKLFDGAMHRFTVAIGDAVLPELTWPDTSLSTPRLPANETAYQVPDYAFDPEYYLSLYPDVAEVALRDPEFDPADHFWECGIDEGRHPSPFYDIEFVQHKLHKISDETLDRRATTQTFFSLPKDRRFVPNRWFSPHVFQATYRDLLPHGLTPYELFEFYCANVRDAALSPSGLFDESAYRQRYPFVDTYVVEERFRSGFHHFIILGWQHGHRNLPQFGEGLFAAERRGSEERNTLFHRSGELRQVVPWFLETFYLEIYPDVREEKRRGYIQSGLEHFLTVGSRQNRVPHPAYLEPVRQSNGDVALFLQRACDAPAPAIDGRLSLDNAAALYDHLRSTSPIGDRALSNVIWRYVALPWLEGDFNAERYLAANPDLAHAFSHDRRSAAEHWRAHGIREGRLAPGSNLFARRTLSPIDLLRGGKGVNLFGPLTLPTGLGAAARGYAEALRQVGVDVDTYDISGLLHEGETIDVFSPSRLRHSINLIVINPDQVLSLTTRYGTSLFDHRVNVGFWVWELPAGRPEWRSAFACFDVIVTPSDFCTKTFSGETDAKVFTIPYAVDHRRLETQLAQFKQNRWIDLIQEQKRLGRKAVLFIMDASSYTARKGVDVFLRIAELAELARPGGFLFVLKTHSRDQSGGEDVAGDIPPSVVVIDEVLPWPDLCTLKQAADVFVSPHRSEGFGLNIFESIILGVPVICSPFGGGPDSLPADFPFFIGGGLQEVGRQLGPYRPSAIWFEPDPHSAVERLLAFFDDEDENREYFRGLQEIYARDLSVEMIGRRLCDLLTRCCGLWLDKDPLAELFERSRSECFDLELGSALNDGSHSVSAMVQSCLSPTFSVVTPTWNSDPQWLLELYGDLCAQTEHSWEWCLYDDGSTRKATLETIRSLRSRDARVKLQLGAENVGISDATNRAVSISSGEYLVFIDHDDRVAPDLIEAYKAAIGKTVAPDVIYCDEDKLAPDGTTGDHYFKPDWSPEHLLSTMYVLHCLCVRKSLFLRLGGYREDYNGAQDHDFLLRAASLNAKVHHVDRVLYHWRQSRGSTATASETKPYAQAAGRLAVADHLRRLGIDGCVENGLVPGTYRVRPKFPATAVALNVLTSCTRRNSDSSTYVEHLIRSVLAHDYPVEIEVRVIVDKHALATAKSLAKLDPRVRVIPFDRGDAPFNFSEKANFAIRGCTTDRVVLLNDDMEATSGAWLEALLEVLELPKVGIVSGRLLYANNTVQHSGVVLGINGSASHVFVGAPADYVGYNAFTHVIRNYAAVTGALMAFRRSLFNRVGGFDTEFPVDFNDTDFCLRVIQAGERVVFTPFAEMRHFESRSAVRLSADSYDEYRFCQKWHGYIGRDPYYNANLGRSSAMYEAPGYA